MIETRTDTAGCLYLGITLPGNERVFISMNEAESLATAIRYKLSELRKCSC